MTNEFTGIYGTYMARRLCCIAVLEHKSHKRITMTLVSRLALQQNQCTLYPRKPICYGYKPFSQAGDCEVLESGP